MRYREARYRKAARRASIDLTLQVRNTSELRLGLFQVAIQVSPCKLRVKLRMFFEVLNVSL